MSRKYDARLGRLEKRQSPSQSVIIMASQNHCASSEGTHTWERKPVESTAGFRRRVSVDAERITHGGTVVILPCNGRDR